ncbi:MAG: asparagine synthetase B, partial [bacterium]|nr:asparagine synthetase B [bacterium]
MCGICGFYQLEQEAGMRDLTRMTDRIIHRGPDDDGYFFRGDAGLAARRLSIIDLQTGHQPLSSQSQRNWLAYNGEVYNFNELKKELVQKGYKFRTKTDTEVIVNLYEEYGVGFVE